MTTRTAAIVIDNFLPDSEWTNIQDRILDYLHTSEFVENRNEPYGYILECLKRKLKELDIYQTHWDFNLDEWSFINTLPSEINRESSGTGYHIDFGGLIYYCHPEWNADWGGHLKFQNCDVDKIIPEPNRFVWINPKVPHGIEVVNSNAETNRVTVVGWPEGCVEYPSATIKINTPIEID